MKKPILLLFTIFALSLSAYAQSKIGVINAQEIVSKSKRGVQIQRSLEALQKSKSAELKIMQDAIKKLEKEIVNPALNVQVREQKSVEIQSKRTELKRKYEDAQRDFQRESQKQLLQLEKEIAPMINNYGKANGFTVIYDLSRAGIVYFDSAIEITNAIVAALDAKTP